MKLTMKKGFTLPFFMYAVENIMLFIFLLLTLQEIAVNDRIYIIISSEYPI